VQRSNFQIDQLLEHCQAFLGPVEYCTLLGVRVPKHPIYKYCTLPGAEAKLPTAIDSSVCGL